MNAINDLSKLLSINSGVLITSAIGVILLYVLFVVRSFQAEPKIHSKEETEESRCSTSISTELKIKDGFRMGSSELRGTSDYGGPGRD